MTQETDEREISSYDDVRAARKAAKAAKKAAKPRGIDFPIWQAMPMPLLVFFGIVALVTLVLVVVVMLNPPTPQIGLAERRSAPAETLSHDVGPIILAPIPEQLPPTKPPCDELSRLVIEGGEPAQVRLGGVLERLCVHAEGDDPFARAVRALDGARIRFARFARSGDTSTVSVADPVRVLVNVQFARRDLSALWIGPLLAHEGFHLLHKGEPWTAELEYEARAVELRACRLLIGVEGWSRGCTDAKRLLDFGRERAMQMLARAGFERAKG